MPRKKAEPKPAKSGGIATDKGGRTLVDEGGRPVRKEDQ